MSRGFRFALVAVAMLLPASAGAQSDVPTLQDPPTQREEGLPAPAELEAAVPGEATTATIPTRLIAGKIPPPPTGKGQVVFYRTGAIMGFAISCAVQENGAKLSSLPPGRYAVITADPGVHSYSVRSEATDTLRMEIEPDETYFAKCAIGAGIAAGRPNLSPSDELSFAKLKLKPVKQQ